MRLLEPRFGELCAELDAYGIADTVQHKDLHQRNVFLDRGQPRILDWGDTTISHPFFSLVTTFHMLAERCGCTPGDGAYDRFREAYLEPWGSGWNDAFSLAIAIGDLALAISWIRVRDGLPAAARPMFDGWLGEILRGAISRALG